MKHKIKESVIIWSFITIISMIVINTVFSYIRMRWFIGNENTTNINFRIQKNSWVFLMVIFVWPIIEEIFFRKWVVNLFMKWEFNYVISVLLSNLIFAFLHADPFFLPYFLNGCLYSIGYKNTNTIKTPIISHIIFNFFVFSISFY